jgi:hypothetical protein
VNRDPLLLCERHAEEMVDPGERVCIMAESLSCEGEEVEYEPVDQMRAHYHRLSEERDAYMARAVGAEADLKCREQEIKALRETLHDLLEDS